MKKLKFAIIGAGTAGIATAIMLAQQDIDVTIFEKAPKLEPVGAGLLLQPSGLAVFKHLGILDDAIQLGAKVTGLQGCLPNQHLLIDTHYKQAHSDFYGIGIHRATLCHLLAQKAQQYSDLISWRIGTDITDYHEYTHEVRISGNDEHGYFDANFDAILIANGARSHLRPKAWVKLDRPYPWGAKWIILPECRVVNSAILHQFHDQSKIMLGILPTGATPDAPTERLSSVFWSLPKANLEQFLRRKEDYLSWISFIEQRWPEVAAWLDTALSNSNQTWLTAQYRDVVMHKYGQGRIGVIGDAAHAMSPQLGQGANMALLDAWALGQAVQDARLRQQIDWSLLWRQYHQHRQSSTQFYQFLSRLLTPLYQSDHCWTGGLRNLIFAWMYQFPYFRKEMAITVSGLKSGMFSQMHYHEIARSTLAMKKNL